jgi:hypothetical protein
MSGGGFVTTSSARAEKGPVIFSTVSPEAVPGLAVIGVAFRAVRDGECVWERGEPERVRAIVRVSRRYDDEAPQRRLSRDAARAAVRRMQGETHGR